MMAGELLGGARADGGQLHAGEVAAVAERGADPLGPVGGGDHEPGHVGEPVQGGAQGRAVVVGVDDLDRGDHDGLGAGGPQRRRHLRRLAGRTGDHDLLPEQRAGLEPVEIGCRHRADHDHARGLEMLVGDGAQRGPHGVLLGTGAPAHRGRRRVRRQAAFQEPRHDLGQSADAHEHDDRAPEAGDGSPVELAALGGILVTGDHRERGGGVAEGDRDAGVGGRRDRGGDAGNDLVGHPRVLQRRRLLAAPGEHERVAALQAHDLLTGQAPLDEQGIDVLLGHHGVAGALGHTDALGVGRGQIEEGRHREPVVDDDVGTSHHLDPSHGHQAGIAGSGAHEVDGHGPSLEGALSPPFPSRAGDPSGPRASDGGGRRPRRHAPAPARTAVPSDQRRRHVANRSLSAKLMRSRHRRPAWNCSPSATARPGWMPRPVRAGPPSSSGCPGERPERRVRREAAARELCAGCPVLEPCRQLARTNRENGFWGGETEEERAAAGYAPRSISRRAVQEAAACAS